MPNQLDVIMGLTCLPPAHFKISGWNESIKVHTAKSLAEQVRKLGCHKTYNLEKVRMGDVKVKDDTDEFRI